MTDLILDAEKEAKLAAKPKAKAKKKTGVEVVYSGTYYNKIDNKTTVPSPYTVTIMVNDDKDYEPPHEKRLHVLGKNKLVDHWFRQNLHEYPGFGGVRECRVVEVINHNSVKKADPKNLTLDTMNVDQLAAYCALHDIPVDIAGCPTIASARQAIKDFEDNKRLDAEKLKNDEQKAADAEKAKYEDVEDILDFVGAK